MSARSEDAYAVADALHNATEKAATLLEQLHDANERMKGAAQGVLPDGTPVEDVLEELKELKITNMWLRKRIRRIWDRTYKTEETSAQRLNAIRGICNEKEMPK